MTLQEAEREMARLMKAEKDFVEKNPLPFKVNKRGIERCTATSSQQRKRHTQIEILEADRNRFGEQLAANPGFADILICWIVWVQGETPCDTERLLEKATCGGKILEGIEQVDALVESISGFIQENGFRITESGGGPYGWDIGVPCTDKEARKLCDLLYKKFSKAIKSELITLRKEFNDFCLPNLTNWPELDEWIRKNGKP